MPLLCTKYPLKENNLPTKDKVAGPKRVHYLEVPLYRFAVSRSSIDCVHCFPSTLTGTWSSPTRRGTRPPPCSSFSLTMIDDHRAVLFGGKTKPRTTKEVYILDLTGMVCFLIVRFNVVGKNVSSNVSDHESPSSVNNNLK